VAGFGRTRQAIEHLFQGDMPVEVVAPVPAHPFQSFALDRPLNAPDETELEVRPCCQRRDEVYAAGQMQCGQLFCVVGFCRLLRSE
jgi:hypothetical protein